MAATTAKKEKTPCHKRVAPLGLNSYEAADRLGLSQTAFYDLVNKQALYKPDNTKAIKGDTNLLFVPLWSEEIIQMIFSCAFHYAARGSAVHR